MRALISIAVVAVAFGVLGATHAQAAGTTTMSDKVVAAIAADLGLVQDASCYVGQRSASHPSWALLMTTPVLRDGCRGRGGAYVVHKVHRHWTHPFDIAAVMLPCRNLKRSLHRTGAPPSVFRDFRAAGACTHRGS